MLNKLKYINTTDELYIQAKQIRIACFFEGMDNVEDLINDKFETNAMHIVYLDEKQQVLGTGRIHMEESTGIISQMAIKIEHQRSGIGREILNELILKCKMLGVEKIELSARETALEFYSKVGFKPFGIDILQLKRGLYIKK